ncbi:MAG: T9SS type A sorting domain-containing protein, partial [Bacteroidota bacterium]|nr:T9SS type A sorting domain-containing protein [Bacteroidota bacterium]
IDFIVQDKDINGQNFGPYWMAWTKDHSLIRKPEVRHGVTVNPSPFEVTVEWDTISDESDVWDSLGTHDCECKTMTNVNQVFQETAQVIIYPNPSSDGNIQVNSSHAIFSIEVLNLLGQSVYREKYNGLKKLVTMNLGEMDKGIYVLKVSNSEYNYVVKKIWLQ